MGAVNVDGLSHNDTIKVLGGSDPAAPLQLQFAKQYISNPQAVVSLEMKRKPRGGWGMAVKALPNGGVSVTTVKRGSPAAVAGVKVDDFLMQIDRADVANKPNTQVVGMLKGAGKTCVVAVRRSLSTVVTPRGGGSLGLTYDTYTHIYIYMFCTVLFTVFVFFLSICLSVCLSLSLSLSLWLSLFLGRALLYPMFMLTCAISLLRRHHTHTHKVAVRVGNRSAGCGCSEQEGRLWGQGDGWVNPLGD